MDKEWHDHCAKAVESLQAEAVVKDAFIDNPNADNFLKLVKDISKKEDLPDDVVKAIKDFDYDQCTPDTISNFQIPNYGW